MQRAMAAGSAPDTTSRPAADPCTAAASAASTASTASTVPTASASVFQPGLHFSGAAGEAAAVQQSLAQWIAQFDAQLTALESALADAFSRSALNLAQRVLRHELATRPEHVAALAREAVNSLVASARHITVWVHAQDQAMVSAAMEQGMGLPTAQVRVHADIERGGCRIESDAGDIDARISARWDQMAQAAGSTLAWPKSGVSGDTAA